jgi:hypothetical protein
MMGALLIAFGYLSLIWTCGWWGLLAIPVHVGIMLLALPRGEMKRPWRP